MVIAKKQVSWNYVLYGLIVVAILGLSWFGGIIAERVVQANIRTTAHERALLYKSTLNNAINRLRYLPLVISQHPAISGLLETQQGLEKARDYLSSINTASNAAVIYVLDTTGKTIASSNWRKTESFEGKNYGFRPYFQDALAGREGRFFAIGVTTGRAGYFFSRPVFSQAASGAVLGVVVVKVELEKLQAEWGEGGENVFVTDQSGVVILSSNPGWTYKTIRPLTIEALNKIAASRTFVGQILEPLIFDNEQGDFKGSVFMEGVQYYVSITQPDENGLAISYLAELETARNAKYLSIVLLLTASVLSLVIFLYVRERKRKRLLDSEAREARRIRKINERLEGEITSRKQVEKELRNAQEELVMETKMAALGRMSAAIAHEVNQPIAAIRTFAASSKLLLGRGKNKDAAQTLDEISQMTERLANITGDLKLLARNSSEQHSRVDLKVAIANSIKLFEDEFAKSTVTLKQDIPEDPVWVDGSLTRIEQVLINLIRNALDAMADVSVKPVLTVCLFTQNGEAVLKIQDRGIGFSAKVAENLFDPFFTTKPLGQGTGLGLAISYGIVEEMGGKLRARNLEEGGAVFSVRLALAAPVDDKAAMEAVV